MQAASLPIIIGVAPGAGARIAIVGGRLSDALREAIQIGAMAVKFPMSGHLKVLPPLFQRQLEAIAGRWQTTHHIA